MAIYALSFFSISSLTQQVCIKCCLASAICVLL